MLLSHALAHCNCERLDSLLALWREWREEEASRVLCEHTDRLREEEGERGVDAGLTAMKRTAALHQDYQTLHEISKAIAEGKSFRAWMQACGVVLRQRDLQEKLWKRTGIERGLEVEVEVDGMGEREGEREAEARAGGQGQGQRRRDRVGEVESGGTGDWDAEGERVRGSMEGTGQRGEAVIWREGRREGGWRDTDGDNERWMSAEGNRR